MKTKVSVNKKVNMKTFFKVSVLLLLVSFQSCSKGEIEEVNLVEEKKSIEANKSFAASNNQSNEGTVENKMQWVAYLTAQALLQDNPITGDSAEQDFVNTLTGGFAPSYDIVRLDDLLTNDNGAFRFAFAKAFGYYSDEDACGANGGKPKGAARPDDDDDGTGGGGVPAAPGDTNGSVFLGEVPVPSETEIYIDQLINDYNFEIYLPNGYDELDNSVISTAVTIALINNEAYYHTPGICNVNSVNVTPQSEGNIILVREY